MTISLKIDSSRKITVLEHASCSLSAIAELLILYVVAYWCCRYDVGGRSGMWLQVVCSWLGAEFARLRTTVNQRVEEFKADNIDRISDLPSARTVVHRLFPHSMILLMLHWMDSMVGSESLPKFRHGPTVDVSSLGASEVLNHRELDHSYVADDCEESKLFSFIQLILEFANGCLVSGIAHVLYPHLLQAQL